MINEKWIENLQKIINPVSKASLLSEERIIKCEEQEGKLVVEYKRDGIDVAQKKQIEESFHLAFASSFAKENIFISTVSQKSTQVAQKLTPAPEQAQIKTGHGQVGPKKRVPGVKHLIAIGSGKGGVGKSTVSVNFAYSLRNLGYKVGIIDADVYGPSLPMLMGLKNQKPKATAEKKILPLESLGIKCMSFGFFIEENDPVIWRGPMLGGVLNQFLFDTDWSDTDFLIIDLPPGTGDMHLSLIQNTEVDAAIVVSTPQDVALLDSVKGLEMFRKLNIPKLFMIENMSQFICHECGTHHSIFGKDGVAKRAKELEVDFLGGIYLDIHLRESSDQGTPYMAQEKYRNTDVWNSFEKATKNFTDHFLVPVKENKTGFLSKFFSK